MDNLITGEVTIQSINVNTGVVVNYPPEYNDISLANLKNMFSCDTSATFKMVLPNRRLTGYYNTNNVWKIAVSEHDFEQSIMNYNMHTFETVDVIENYPIWTNKVLILDKDYITFIADIPQPLVGRFVRGVGLVPSVSTAGSSQGYTYGRTVTNLKLTSPCFQDTDNLLRITYRLYFDDAVSASPKTNVSDGFYKYIKNAFKTVSDGSVTNSNTVGFYKSDSKATSNFYNWDSQDTINLSTNVNFVGSAINRKATDSSLMPTNNMSVTTYSNGSKTTGTHTTLSDTVTMGTFFRTVVLGTTSDDSANSYSRPFIYHNAVPSNTSPLQNTFKMTSGGTNFPFLNAAYLSAMTGSITMGVGGWVTQAYPKLFKVDITNTGSNGTATYKIKSLKFTGGFIQNTYCPREATLPQEGETTTDSSYFRKADNEQIIIGNIESGGTTVRTPDDSKYVVATNCMRTKNAVALYNIETGEKKCLDSTTITSFNIANTSDCAVSGGFTFVTCATTGLWKIDSTFSTATHITVAGVDDTKAYQIDVKANGDLWVMFEGGLAQSSDLGSTWTVYNTISPVLFSVTGITDNNWANVASMCIDPNHADDRILFILGTGGGTNNANGFVWWDRVTATATKPTNGIPFSTFTLSENLKRSDLIKCVNGAWFSHGQNVSTVANTVIKTLHVFNYNASTLNTTKTLGANIAFTPRVYPATVAGIDGMFIGSGRSEYYSSGFSVTSAFFVNSVNANTLPATITESVSQVEFFCKFGNNDMTSDMRTYNPNSNGAHGSNPICYLKNSNMMLYCNSAYYGNALRVAPLIIDPTVTNYSTYESACWESYGWDGSNWVLGNSNSKTCHASADALLDGLTISFTDGVSGTSFISTDFFTFVVGNGLMKDNFTTYTYSIPYYNEATETITSFEPYAALPDNRVLFTPADPDLAGSSTIYNYSYKRGRITSCVSNRIFYSEQRADAGTAFTLKFKPIIAYSSGSGKYIGVANSTTGANLLTARITGAGTMVIRNSSDNTVATITGITYTTEITMERVGDNTIKVYDASIVSGLGSAGTPYYTSAIIGNAVAVKAEIPSTSPYVEMGWYDVTFSSTDTSVYRVICGDSGTSTGIFNSKFTGLTCTSLMGDSKVYVNAVEQTIISASPLTIPTTGQVRLGAGGTLTFPNAVSGSTITGYVTAHYHP